MKSVRFAGGSIRPWPNEKLRRIHRPRLNPALLLAVDDLLLGRTALF